MQNASIAERTFREAEAAFQEAEIRLLTAQQNLANLGLPVKADDFANLRPNEISRQIQFLGLPPTLVNGLDGLATSNLFPLDTSLDGTLVERHVVAGEVVDTAKPLFVVTDVSHLWLTLAVRQDEAKFIAPRSNRAVSTQRQQRDVRDQGSGQLDQHGGRQRDANGEGARRPAERRTAACEPTRSAPGGSCCARSRKRSSCRARPFIGTATATWSSCATRTSSKQGAPKFFHVREVRSGVKEGDRPKSSPACCRAK